MAMKIAAEVLDKAVADGHLKVEDATVEISDKASPTGKGVSQAFKAFTALTVQGMAILCGGKTKPATPKPEGDDERTDEDKAAGACDYFNYGYNLDVRAGIRQALMSGLEGPEKEIKKAVAGLVAMGLEGDAISTAIKNSPKFSGVEGIDKFISAALAK